jgi:hypothetical protein
MGITARGAWEAVKRHFREMGHDTQSHPFRVIGIGDMSGDVFGNGMLLSRHIKLVAAFDHRHIFLDPGADPATSFAERERVFKLPRSSWADYNTGLISTGGGIYPRSAKSITITPQVKQVLGIAVDAMTPTERTLDSRVRLRMQKRNVKGKNDRTVWGQRRLGLRKCDVPTDADVPAKARKPARDGESELVEEPPMPKCNVYCQDRSVTKLTISLQGLAIMLGIIVKGHGIQSQITTSVAFLSTATGPSTLNMIDSGGPEGQRGELGVPPSTHQVDVGRVVGAGSGGHKRGIKESLFQGKNLVAAR